MSFVADSASQDARAFFEVEICHNKAPRASKVSPKARMLFQIPGEGLAWGSTGELWGGEDIYGPLLGAHSQASVFGIEGEAFELYAV